VILVQKGIQLEVLLGTDLITKLGFSRIENSDQTDLLTGLSYKSAEESDQDVGQVPSKEVAVSSVRVAVHLLKAVKVPGCHGRMVKVKVDNIESLVSPCCFVLIRTKKIGQALWLQVV